MSVTGGLGAAAGRAKPTVENLAAQQKVRKSAFEAEKTRQEFENVPDAPANDPSAPPVYDEKYILMVKDLKKHFPIKGGMMNRVVGYVKAVDGVTFNLKRGTTLGLVGESGCGKTTVGRTILRLSGEKTAGHVLFNGREVYSLSKQELRDART